MHFKLLKVIRQSRNYSHGVGHHKTQLEIAIENRATLDFLPKPTVFYYTV